MNSNIKMEKLTLAIITMKQTNERLQRRRFKTYVWISKWLKP